MLSLVLVMACADPYKAAEAIDTIEAYEAFLVENPNSGHAMKAELRLQDMYLEKARTDKTLEAYDTFLSKFPESQLATKATDERRTFLFAWAEETNTPDSWQKYMDEYHRGDKKRIQDAKRRKHMAEHLDAVEVGELEMKEVNLAEDPKGPMNGWGFYVTVKNVGDQTIEKLNLQIEYLNEEGKALDDDRWPVVAKRLPGNLPFETGFDKPIGPGESRDWEWTQGEFPDGYANKARVVPVSIAFAE